MLDDLARNVAGQRSAAGKHVSNRVNQSFGRPGFDEITARAGVQGFENPFAVLIYGHHDDLQGRHHFLEFSDALDAGHPGQFDIHQHHIRFFRGDGLEGFFGRAARDDALDVLEVLEYLQKLFAQPAVILDHGDSFFHRRRDFTIRAGLPFPLELAAGRRKRSSTVVPEPKRLSMSQVPPRSASRRFILISPWPARSPLGAKPHPSSWMHTSSSLSSYAMVSVSSEAPACLITLCTASFTAIVILWRVWLETSMLRGRSRPCSRQGK